MILARLLSATRRWLAGYMGEMDRGISMMHSQEALLGRPDHREPDHRAG